MKCKRKSMMIVMLVLFCLSFAFSPSASAAEDPLSGDVDGNGMVDLGDLILTLQVVSGGPLPAPPAPNALLNEAGRIGIAEAVYILQRLAELRTVPNYVSLRSDPGDYIGWGEAYLYTGADAIITVKATGNHLAVSISGDEHWQGHFKSPSSQSRLQAGYYGEIQRYPFHSPARGGLDWYGEGRGCNSLTGWFAVDSVTYVSGTLKAIDLRFEQHCEGAATALQGQIHWTANDAAQPPGPVNPPPEGLWQPASGATPQSGNYIYLESEPGDRVGQGGVFTYTQADAILFLGAEGNHLAVTVTGDESWSGDFAVMNSLDKLQPGYYGRLQDYPFYNPVKGGLSWSGEGRSCNRLEGWFAVDGVSYADGVMTAIDLRFEQRCDGATAPLHGRIHWTAGDATQPPGPVNPPPEGLWQPGSGTTPASGNYIYLESDPGDALGQGGVYTYTAMDSIISAAATGNLLSFTVNGAEVWNGSFQAMNILDRVQPGYYGRLQRYPLHNPAKGGLSWSGEGRGCNRLEGWFAVDGVTYVEGVLTAIDLRFEQRCDGATAPLHGRIHWTAADAAQPQQSPIDPPPQGLWQPPPDSTPASGNYVFFESDSGDYIGGGGVYTYTQTDAVLSVAAAGNRLTLTVTGEERWLGEFQTMNSLGKFQPGYYGQLQRYPFHNPVSGGLAWYAEGRGCNTLTGWFVVDSVSYAGDVLKAIDLRFAQHCEGVTPAFHGRIHWRADDTTQPPGPVDPPPAGLWRPSPGATPASGNYVYLESDPGDYVGAGRVYTYTHDNDGIIIETLENRLTVTIEGEDWWFGNFKAMNILDIVRPGYYGDLRQYPWHNPVRGGLAWYGEGRSCGESTGWFAVDRISHVDGVLTALDLRFEQHCGSGGGPALRGQVHWEVAYADLPPGPVSPPPEGLWQPAAGATPANGNYVYLRSDTGNDIGRETYTYTQANAIISVNASQNKLALTVDGDETWYGHFQTRDGLDRLEPGFYGLLQCFDHNPARGGFSWSGEGPGCDALPGWFVVDSITFSGDVLTAVDLRFAQHHGGGTSVLYGQIHWRADDATQPPGPVNPPPEGLWRPSPGATPAGGNYVYLESDPGDYIGAGRLYTFTPERDNIAISSAENQLHVVITNRGWWSGDFQTMNTLDQLQVGYYGNLQRYPMHNPARGGLAWGGDGRGCNELTGWVVVDGVTYSGDVLTALDLRFEQHCGGGVPALHGQIHWIW